MASASIFFSLTQVLPLYRGLILPCIEYGSHVWGGREDERGSTHMSLLKRMETKAFYLIKSPALTDCLDSLSHRRNVASLTIFYRYFHAERSSELANCIHYASCGLAAQVFLLILIPILSIFPMQELTSIFTLSSLTLVSTKTLFHCLFIHLPMP